MAHYDTRYPQYEIPPSPPKRWPLAGVMAIDTVVAFIAWILITIVIPLVFITVRASQQGLSLPGGLQNQQQALRLLGPDGVFVTLLVQNIVFVLVPVIRVALIRHEPLAEIGFRVDPLPRLVLTGLGLGVVVLLCNVLISSLFNSIGIRQNQAAQYPLFQGQYAGQALFFLGAAIIAPIGEEVLFRGYMFNAIRQTFQSRPWGLPLAYLLSALFFMAAHSLAATEGVIGLLVPTFLMGLVLAWGMQRTGSLIPGIIAHSLNNSFALAALLYCVNNPHANICPTL